MRAALCTSACAFVFALALMFAPMSARADQTDPRLDALFEALQAADSDKKARPVVDAIWNIWLAADGINTSRDMRYGIDAMNARQYGLAVSVFTKLIQRRPDFAEAWNKRATVYFLAGRLDEAVADCVKVLDLEPRHFGALAGLGQIYAQRGELEAALAWFERALRINPHMPQVRESMRILRRELRGRAI